MLPLFIADFFLNILLTSFVRHWYTRQQSVGRELALAVFNFGINSLASLLAFYSCRNVWLNFRNPVCSQHYGMYGCAFIAAALTAVLTGAVLGIRSARAKGIMVSKAVTRPLMLTLCLLVSGGLLSASLIHDAQQNIALTAFCRKFVQTAGESEKLRGYVELTNRGWLPVSLEGMTLVSSRDGSDESPIEASILVKGQTLRIWLDDTSLDLSRKGGNELRLLTADGAEADLLETPELKVGECYCLHDGIGKIVPAEETIPPEAPAFSCAGGFYDEGFTLTITAQPGTEIYYTTDGSVPTRKSNRYTAPIFVDNPTAQPNRYRSISNVVTADGTYRPTENVDKAFVLRAAAIDGRGNVSQTTTATYFVGLNQYKDTAVVALTADPEVLFGDDGIYVLGLHYERWQEYMLPVLRLRHMISYQSMRVLRKLHIGNDNLYHHLQYDYDPVNFNPVPNFWLRGRASEREANFEFYNGDSRLNQKVGIRIQGGEHSRNISLKRFTIRAREEYAGSDYFDAPIFSEIRSHSLVLNPGDNNALVPRLAAGRATAVQQSMKTVYFLNGEFWRECYLLDFFSEEYLGEYYGISPQRIQMVKVGTPRRLKEQTIRILDELQSLTAGLDTTSDTGYETLCRQVDIQSFADFAAINFYVGNCDFGDSKNYILWRTFLPDAAEKADDRWHFGLYDLDLMIYPGDPEKMDTPAVNPYLESMYSEPLKDHFLFSACMENAAFRQQYALTLMDLINTNFSINSVASAMEPLGLDIETHAQGFYLKRAPYAIEYTADFLGIPNAVGTLTLNVDGGREIRLNTLELYLNGSWQGQYYTAYPVTLTAQGEGFDHWEITVGGVTTQIDDSCITVEIQKEGVEVHGIYQ